VSTDLIELEPLLSQYDSGKLIVGPLLSLSPNSNFRSFYIAGKGSKVYGSIGLGFVELEENAQRQRLDIVDKLKGRFRAVVIFGSHSEMAQAVHALWPNEETLRILELAALEAQPTKPVPGPAFDDKQGMRPDNWGEQLFDIETVSAKTGSLSSRLPNVASSWPISDGRAATPQLQQSRDNQDSFPAAVLELQSLIPADNVPKQPVAGGKTLASTLVRFAAIGVIVGLAWMMVSSSAWQVAEQAMSAGVRTFLAAVNRDNGPSQVAATPAKTDKTAPVSIAPSSPPSPPLQGTSAQDGTAPIPTPRSQPPRAAATTGIASVSGSQSKPAEVVSGAPTITSISGPQSPPPRVAPTGTAPVSGPRSQPPKAASAEPNAPQSPSPPGGAATAPVSGPRSSAATRIDSDSVAMLVSRAENLLKSGDFASARLLLRRAADSGSANAALMLGATFDPRIIHDIGPIGIEPDIAQARQWYEKAAQLGSEIAVQRLAKLTQMAP